jgi:hypothetical protein
MTLLEAIRSTSAVLYAHVQVRSSMLLLCCLLCIGCSACCPVVLSHLMCAAPGIDRCRALQTLRIH